MVFTLIVLALFGLAVAMFYAYNVASIPMTQGVESPEEADKLRKISSAIADGAMAFLKQEYRYMAYFMVGFAVVISLLVDD